MSEAFGKPGIEPRWTHGDKDGVGTAYSSGTQIWFTLWNGILTEVYYPTVDRPQIRDLQFLITDGATFFHEEKRHLKHKTERLSVESPAYGIVNSDPEGRYEISKQIICDPSHPVILQKTSISGDESFLKNLKLYVLCAPHIDVGGWGNNGNVIWVDGKKVLIAEKNGTYLAIAANIPYKKTSCGYVGSSDGWTDISQHYEMTYEFDSAPDGNIALTGEIDLNSSRDFVLGIAMGNSMHNAVTRLFQSIYENFDDNRRKYIKEWEREFDNILPLEEYSMDGGRLYRSSYGVLMTHEDKTYEGAMIASLSIPWGEVAGDNDRGGYHLVWTRDLCNGSTAAIAAGITDIALRSLIYLSVSQAENGGFAQNFWIDGTPYWHGIQLDEAAFPIILAWRLKQENALHGFDPYTMVMDASRFILTNGPVTGQERWEEASGYSPSTLASNIAALICAASIARDRGNDDSAQYLEEYADFLECHIEDWTVTNNGTLVEGIRRHYVRIRPEEVGSSVPGEGADFGMLKISNLPEFDKSLFHADRIVDGGFLELVRYGIRRADDPVIRDSVKVIDQILKVDTPNGPAWHRYNHDGYGQRDDGSAFKDWGTGRAWPLLTGERGHYELALGKSPDPYLDAMEKFSSDTLLIPEQVWDKEDFPEKHLNLGEATGSARPLVWAHSEYIKLLRSSMDNKVFDMIGPVEDRYITDRRKCLKVEIWKQNRMVKEVTNGYKLRIQALEKFKLHWSVDNWSEVSDLESEETELDIHYADFDTANFPGKTLIFTFYWVASGGWEGTDYSVKISDGPKTSH